MKPNQPNKKAYIRRSESYKVEALKLAEHAGYAEAARQLGLHESQLYAWRAKQAQQHSISHREQEQATEIAKLKRELLLAQEEVAILKKASAFFARELR